MLSFSRRRARCGLKRLWIAILLLVSQPLPAAKPQATSPSPCAIALVPHEGETTTDQRIARLQDSVRRAESRTPRSRARWMEQLAWAYVAKAREALDPGYYTLAEQCAECIESATTTQSTAALLLRGHVWLNMHRFHDAESVARQLVERRGRWFDHALLGDALVETGRLDEAVLPYQTMADLRPGPEAYIRIAHLRRLKGDLVGAVDLFRRAAGSFGPGAPEAAAWSFTQLARTELSAGRREACRRAVEAALRLAPSYAPALLVQGRLDLAVGEYERALSLLRNAERAQPMPEYRWALIEALSATGRTEEAQQLEQRFLATAVYDDPRTLSLYLASQSQQPAEAIRLARAELTSREDAMTLDAMAWSLFANGEAHEARSWAERALATGTREARLFLHAGLIALAAGDHRTARRWLNSARSTADTLYPSERSRLDEASAAVADSSVATVSRREAPISKP